MVALAPQSAVVTLITHVPHCPAHKGIEHYRHLLFFAVISQDQGCLRGLAVASNLQSLATLYGKHVTGFCMMYTGLPYCTSVKPKEPALYAYGEWKWGSVQDHLLCK